jgi:hypothetical protein
VNVNVLHRLALEERMQGQPRFVLDLVPQARTTGMALPGSAIHEQLPPASVRLLGLAGCVRSDAIRPTLSLLGADREHRKT